MSVISDRFKTEYQKYITREGSQNLLTWLESTDFFEAPASTRFHNSYKEGLCLHSIYTFMETIRLLKAYPEVKVSMETAAICSLLHDVCKIGCYKVSMRNVKVDGKWIQKPYYEFNEDFPYGGHGSKSVFLIERYMRLTEEEAIAINCHMGFSDRDSNNWSVGNAYSYSNFAWIIHVADEAASFIREGSGIE